MMGNTANLALRPRNLLILSFLLVFIAAWQAEAAGFRLLYSNDNLGELDGCG